MENYRLHVKVGAHEFSGEGPEECVKRDFEEWKSLISGAARGPALSLGSTEGQQRDVEIDGERLNRVFVVDEKRQLLTLRYLPRTDDRDGDSLLLILLGYQTLRSQDEVTVTQLKPSLKQSGCLVDRVDKAAAKYVNQGLLNKGGMGKGGRYSLTNSGRDRATSLLGGLG
ncbi:MAG: hypothetical protein ACRDFW_06155 [bacterium]